MAKRRYNAQMKIQQAGGHLDQMLRQTRAHHVQLSAMADVKANGLMTMAALMMTLSVPYLANDHYQEAVAVLLVFGLLTIMLATFAVMPGIQLPSGSHAHPEKRGANFNLLFFGDFTQLTLDEYKAEMEIVMNDASRAYETQVQEIYVLGKYLAARKYRLLRSAYLSFLTGLLSAIAVLVFVSVRG